MLRKLGTSIFLRNTLSASARPSRQSKSYLKTRRHLLSTRKNRMIYALIKSSRDLFVSYLPSILPCILLATTSNYDISLSISTFIIVMLD
jgi:hypothetical protein